MSISKLSNLSKVLESLVNKNHSAALFIDLSKAFDFIDHEILKQRLLGVGLSVNTVGWFVNYLSYRSQCINIEGLTSSTRNVKIGVPQGSVLGPLLFILYINNIGNNLAHSSFHLYADDIVIYSSASTLDQAVSHLQSDFDAVQHTLSNLKLVLNAEKSKLMMFTKSKSAHSNSCSIATLQGLKIEVVSKYKYLGVLIDDSLSFGLHIQYLVRKLKSKLGLLLESSIVFLLQQGRIRIRMNFIARYVYTYEEFVFMTEATAVQQNDSDRTKNTDNKNN